MVSSVQIRGMLSGEWGNEITVHNGYNRWLRVKELVTHNKAYIKWRGIDGREYHALRLEVGFMFLFFWCVRDPKLIYYFHKKSEAFTSP